MSKTADFNLSHWLQDRFLRLMIWILLRLPYRWRVVLCGWVVSRLIAPLAGYRRRIRDNLALIWPDLAPEAVEGLVRAVPDNVGRSIIEMYSGEEFIRHSARLPLTGDGVQALEQAFKAQRPVVIVTGHFGNYDASRAALISRGYPLGGLYKEMSNRYFNEHYVTALSRIGTPLFARGRKGLAEMVKHLKSGGMVGMVIDQSMRHGEKLAFFGHEALTALSAAELALKYDALLVPCYAVRQDDGLSFQIIVEPPIAHGDAGEMTQALNDSLEALVRRHPEQWLWIHRRWKGAGAPVAPRD